MFLKFTFSTKKKPIENYFLFSIFTYCCCCCCCCCRCCSWCCCGWCCLNNSGKSNHWPQTEAELRGLHTLLVVHSILRLLQNDKNIFASSYSSNTTRFKVQFIFGKMYKLFRILSYFFDISTKESLRVKLGGWAVLLF